MPKKPPTAERVRELLEYDPETGKFYHRRREAGCVTSTYIKISIDNVPYPAHRLAWLYVYGEWPPDFVDHINLDKRDNKLSNLRLADKSQNCANRTVQKNSSSGLKGAFKHKAGQRYGKPWQSQILVRGKNIFLGHFATAEEAHQAYSDAAEKHFGTFARAK